MGATPMLADPTPFEPDRPVDPDEEPRGPEPDPERPVDPLETPEGPVPDQERPVPVDPDDD